VAPPRYCNLLIKTNRATGPNISHSTRYNPMLCYVCVSSINLQQTQMQTRSRVEPNMTRSRVGIRGVPVQHRESLYLPPPCRFRPKAPDQHRDNMYSRHSRIRIVYEQRLAYIPHQSSCTAHHTPQYAPVTEHMEVAHGRVGSPTSSHANTQFLLPNIMPT